MNRHPMNEVSVNDELSLLLIANEKFFVLLTPEKRSVHDRNRHDVNEEIWQNHSNESMVKLNISIVMGASNQLKQNFLIKTFEDEKRNEIDRQTFTH